MSDHKSDVASFLI